MRLPDLLEAMKDVDGVFALAGYLALPMAQDPPTGVSVNTLGMVNTLEACRFSGVRRVIFSSSVAVYGTPVQHPVTEDFGYNSAGLQSSSLLYGASKLMGEALCALFTKLRSRIQRAAFCVCLWGAAARTRRECCLCRENMRPGWPW